MHGFTCVGNGKTLGFTLAELLIALVILGLIATFTIPKVLSSQQSSQSKSIVKEVAGTLSNAYTVYQSQNTVSSATKALDLTPYLNYVSVVTTGAVDGLRTNTGSYSCVTDVTCFKLHNGAMLYTDNNSLTGTATTNGLWFQVDPDGKALEPTAVDSPTKSVGLILYYNGLLRSMATILPNTTNSDGTYNPNPSYDPTWFGWD